MKKDKKLYNPTLDGVMECIFDNIVRDAKETNTPIKDVLNSIKIDGYNATITYELKKK